VRVFPRTNILVLQTEGLRDVNKTMTTIFKFLGLREFTNNFRKYNENKISNKGALFSDFWGLVIRILFTSFTSNHHLKRQLYLFRTSTHGRLFFFFINL